MTNSKINVGSGLDSLLASLSASDASTADGLQKSASATDGIDLESTVADKLNSVLTKKASAPSTSIGENTNMATDITKSILALIKQAETGNNVIDETDEMVADDDARDELTPVDGLTITETARALAQRAAAAGAEVIGEQEDEADAEGEAQLDGYDPEPSDLDKEAALHELVASGIDFDEAIDLVKQASELITMGMQKSAAVSNLMADGYDFEDAAQLVKQASEHLVANQNSGYTELEKAAAVSQLVHEGYGIEDAMAMVKEASGGLVAAGKLVKSSPLSRKAKIAIGAGTAAGVGAGVAAGVALKKKAVKQD